MKKTHLLSLAILGIGAIYMSKKNTNEWKYYGLLLGEAEIKVKILFVCNVISPKNANEASKLIAETIAVESNNGKAKDYSTAYGEGLTQFDRGTFDYVKDFFNRAKYKSLRDKIKMTLFIDITKIKYEDLRRSPLKSILLARLRYYMLPQAIPKNFDGRWLYYKKYFNSTKGATTYEKYVSASKRAVNV